MGGGDEDDEGREKEEKMKKEGGKKDRENVRLGGSTRSARLVLATRMITIDETLMNGDLLRGCAIIL